MKRRLPLIASLAAVLVCSLGGAQAADPVTSATDRPDGTVILDNAYSLMTSGRAQEAKALLAELVRDMPTGWKAIRVKDKKMERVYWNVGAFMLCSATDQSSGGVSEVVWLKQPSYSRAYFLLSYIATDEGNV